MKKTIGMTAAVLTGALVLGLGIYQSDASEADVKLSEEDIRQLVEQQYPGEITELELEKEADRAVYEVGVEGDSKEYDMELDGDTGEVLEIREKEMIAGSNETNGGQNTVKIAESDEKNNSKERSSDILTVDQIEKIVLEEFPGRMIELDLDEDDGRLKYEVEVQNENREEAELDIDAYTGEILKIETETYGGNKHTNADKNLDGILNAAEVKEIALNEFSGKLKELELDKDDGRLIYEVEIKNKGKEAELDIDARTGEILEIEIDD
ncbi:PepSY domain-containing protein [Virgibacillus sp. YIM 98842]|uniref:PepSY domain-containing protein n=1 Tax=Virgibacillus sp. YIM 98842 TaxID=2663533 RepID=UPI0013DC5FE6|nr:PepSY domain-containing protein [Virgibacillus sp. YIM 98842]